MISESDGPLKKEVIIVKRPKIYHHKMHNHRLFHLEQAQNHSCPVSTQVLVCHTYTYKLFGVTI